MKRSNALAIAVGIGLAARLALVATSIGTNDVPFMILWARYARESGIAHAYERQWELNHPPLSLLIIHWLDLSAQKIGIEFTDLLRLFQVAADMVTTVALIAIARMRAAVVDPAILFVLSPAAIAISGFHCNTDPTMIALLVVSILLLLREQGFAAGIAFAAAVGIKIIPLFALPFLLLVKREVRVRFAIAAAIGILAIFAPVVAIAGPAVLRNVFGYSGFAGKWGITAVFLKRAFPIAWWYATYGRFIVAAAVLALFFWQVLSAAGPSPSAQDSRQILAIVPTVMMIVLVLAPGFGIQYLLWPLPLLPYAVGRRMLLVLSTAISFYVLLTYTIWSRGFPWWYADSIAQSPGKPLVTSIGLIIWILIAAGLVDALRRLRAA